MTKEELQKLSKKTKKAFEIQDLISEKKRQLVNVDNYIKDSLRCKKEKERVIIDGYDKLEVQVDKDSVIQLLNTHKESIEEGISQLEVESDNL